MESARRILNSADIVAARAKRGKVSVVVSAVAGVSNKLQEAIDRCSEGEASSPFVEEIRKIHADICRGIRDGLVGFDDKAVMQKAEERLSELDSLLTGLAVFRECPDTIHCRIMGMGELICAPIVEAALAAKGQSVALFDSRKYIFTTGNQKEGDADFARCVDSFSALKDSPSDILLFPGFICSWSSAPGGRCVPGLLGRNGSDFSAAIAAYCLDAERMEFWTDVDGVYTADPRVVPDALLVDDMTYEEAMELSFFGSRILHPKTLAPLSEKNIESWSLNSHNPAARGTRIARGPFPSRGPVRGITCLKNCAMISVSGPGMKGRRGTAARIFSAVGNAGVSILLITQSSSEYTISFCVRRDTAPRVKDVLISEFSLELSSRVINPIRADEDVAIVSVIGDGMKSTRGVAGTFFDSLARGDINISAIAQGSSERSISAVVRAEDGDNAVRIAHQAFFNSTQSIQVYCFGAGTIGGTLLDQIRDQQALLATDGIDIRVMTIANIDGMISDADGIDLADWRGKVAREGRKTDLDGILSFVRETKPLNPVFVDCTASSSLPGRYPDILKAGMNIATPNKRANSMSQAFYRGLRETAKTMHRRFLYETNVGAGLPIIDTLQNLFKSGDRLTGFEGIMSGSLSYIFGRLDGTPEGGLGASFTDAVLEARALGFTEPDVRDDLKGMDVARKALIIAREAGMELELDDIEMRPLFPEGFSTEGSVDDFLKRLRELDGYFEEKMKRLRREGKVLRMGAEIRDGHVSVGTLEVGPDNPLYSVRGGENAFVFRTKRYAPIPLTVRGYGAGAEVTAAGVFGDILRTVSWERRGEPLC